MLLQMMKTTMMIGSGYKMSDGEWNGHKSCLFALEQNNIGGLQAVVIIFLFRHVLIYIYHTSLED